MEEDKKNLQFEALKKFFDNNMKIKEMILKIAPTELDDYNEESRIEYTDKLDKALKEIQNILIDTAKEFNFGEETEQIINANFEKRRESLLISHYEPGLIQKIYDKQISSMNEKLIEEVKDRCVGYTGADEQTLDNLLNKSGSVNEVLHTMHSYIINNEAIMQNIPTLDKKTNEIKEPIILYGEETEISKRIFEQFPVQLDCGPTDIISMQNKILMMIRDRGHALTLDIDTTNEKSFIKYFIPKICNLEMVEKLPGINKITQAGATGMFEISEEILPENIFDFISKVPTDADIIREDEEEIENMAEELEENTEEKQEYIFGEDDAKELAMEEGKEGRRITKIQKLQQKIKETIQNIKQKSKSEKSKEIGENENDRTRDE